MSIARPLSCPGRALITEAIRRGVTGTPNARSVVQIVIERVIRIDQACLDRKTDRGVRRGLKFDDSALTNQPGGRIADVKGSDRIALHIGNYERGSTAGAKFTELPVRCFHAVENRCAGTFILFVDAA